MPNWILRGLRTGIVTTRYPKRAEPMPVNYRGAVRIDPERCRPETSPPCVAVCLTQALSLHGERLRLDLGRCITCGYCVAACPNGAFVLTPEYELAVRRREDLITELVTDV
jgi:formate hydrogenlyase subunit 6/NADH:ubiquinone oxidoreductase subunit I